MFTDRAEAVIDLTEKKVKPRPAEPIEETPPPIETAAPRDVGTSKEAEAAKETAAPMEEATPAERTLEALKTAAKPDAAAKAVLALLEEYFQRAAVLRVGGGSVRGWMSTAMPSRKAVDSLELPLAFPSTLAEAAIEGSARYGPLEVIPGDGMLLSIMDPPPTRAAVVPVMLAGRPTCILYGDVYEEGASFEPPRELLDKVALDLGSALERIIKNRKSG